MTKYRNIVLVVLSSFLSSTSRCAAGDSTSHSITFTDSSGKPFGTLSSSPSGDTLYFSPPGQTQLAIGTFTDSLIQSVMAPSGHLKVSVYLRNCGATVDFATRVVIHDSGDGDLVAVFQGQPEIEPRWDAEGYLKIHHSPLSPEQIFKQKTHSKGRSISFMPDLPRVRPGKYLEFSSYNFGATGRAAGFPAELLLRWAGWAQSTSGLWQENWGNWWSSPPFGDDQMGSLYIQSGINYYENEYSKKKH